MQFGATSEALPAAEDAGARAIENQVAFGNCTGRQAGRPHVGASVAYDAWGDCLGELDEHPGVLRCDIDVDAVRAARSDFCQLADRVLDLPRTQRGGTPALSLRGRGRRLNR